MKAWWPPRALLCLMALAPIVAPVLAPMRAAAQDADVDEQNEYNYFKSVQDDILKKQRDTETLEGRFRLFGRSDDTDKPVDGARPSDPLGGLGVGTQASPLGSLGGSADDAQ